MVRRLLSQYADVLIHTLIAAAVLKATTADWVDFTVIAVVIIATGLVGFIQQGRAASALAGLPCAQRRHGVLDRYATVLL